METYLEVLLRALKAGVTMRLLDGAGGLLGNVLRMSAISLGEVQESVDGFLVCSND